MGARGEHAGQSSGEAVSLPFPALYPRGGKSYTLLRIGRIHATMGHMTDLTANVLLAYDEASDIHINVGASWYETAQSFARELDPLRWHRAAGIIAALSPKNGWANNKAKAAQLYAQNGDGTGCGMRGKHGNGPVDKAVAIYNGADALDILGGEKTRNFFMTIIDPSHTTAVIDAHAHDIAIGRPCTDKERGVLGRKGEYARFSSAYSRAARFIGRPVSEVQAITWVAWRDRLGKGWYG